MKSLVLKVVTIFVTSMLFLSCSKMFTSEDKEYLSFEPEPQYEYKFEKKMANQATLVLAIDDSFSMNAKVKELKYELEGMLRGLLEAGWELDLNVVTCSYYRPDAPKMKTASSLEVADKSDYAAKLKLLMDKASPQIDENTKNDDADERCNQSLEKAWNTVELNNKVNISMLISNEDSCARSDQNLDLPDKYDGKDGKRNNCAPLTHGRVSRFNNKESLVTASFEEWESALKNFSADWYPWFEKNVTPKLYPTSYYVDFFKDLEERGQKKSPGFSHLYVPIVVDDYQCLTESMMKMVEAEKALFMADTTKDETKVFRPDYTVADIGYRYLDIFTELKQDTLFDKEKGDLSLCGELITVVNKVEREIKIRGESVVIQLTRPIDVEATKSSRQPIVRVIRDRKNISEKDHFVNRNGMLKSYGLSWVEIEKDKFILDLYLDSPMVSYDEKKFTITVKNSSVLVVGGEDKVFRLSYIPVGFREKENGVTVN